MGPHWILARATFFYKKNGLRRKLSGWEEIPRLRRAGRLLAFWAAYQDDLLPLTESESLNGKLNCDPGCLLAGHAK